MASEALPAPADAPKPRTAYLVTGVLKIPIQAFLNMILADDPSALGGNRIVEVTDVSSVDSYNHGVSLVTHIEIGFQQPENKAK